MTAQKKDLTALRIEQQEAISHIYETGTSLVLGQMGSGKGIVLATAAQELIRDKVCTRALLIAPIAVCNDVWLREPGAWEHLSGTTWAYALGDAKTREAAVAEQADFTVLNFENVAWLFSKYGKNHGFDILLVDEITKFNAGGAGFKKLRARLNDFTVRAGATGTFVSEKLDHMFYPMLCITADKAPLGRNKQKFLEKYFYPEDYEQRNWSIRSPVELAKLAAVIKPYIVQLPDYTHMLPPLKMDTRYAALPAEALRVYRTMDTHSVVELANGSVIEAPNAAVKSGKVLQIAAGFLYDEEGNTHCIHNAKTRIWSVLRSTYKGQIIWVYQYKEELERLRILIPDGLRLGESKKADADTMCKFRHGQLSNLFIHPKSAGHGIDLTNCCHMVFCSPLWSRDQTRQVIMRMWRTNQTRDCEVTLTVTKDTRETEVVDRETGKAIHFNSLMEHI